MRVFAAVYPTASAVADLDAALAPVRSSSAIRWTPVAHWHVTLAFLGEVRDESVPGVVAAIESTVAEAPPLRLSLRSGGSFSGRSGTVVWAGVAGDVDALVRLSAAVGAAAREAGATYPDRRPEPHLTLGRAVRRGGRGGADGAAAADRVVAALASYAGPPWDVTEVQLVRSRLGPPLRHDTIHRFPLARMTPPA